MRDEKSRKGQNVKYVFTVTVEKDEDVFFASCRELPECFAQGDTVQEALELVHDVIQIVVKDRIANNEGIPQSKAPPRLREKLLVMTDIAPSCKSHSVAAP